MSGCLLYFLDRTTIRQANSQSSNAHASLIFYIVRCKRIQICSRQEFSKLNLRKIACFIFVMCFFCENKNRKLTKLSMIIYFLSFAPSESVYPHAANTIYYPHFAVIINRFMLSDELVSVNPH